jgi:sugar O-acyltransferase (sialic acid O-acetyltransferase NeuD family)
MNILYHSIKRIGVVGNGGFAREIICSLPKGSYDIFVNQKFINKENQHQVKALEAIDINKYKVLLCIGDSHVRKSIVESLPSSTEYITYIDQHAKILDISSVRIGKGSIVCAGSILTTNIDLGDFSQVNLNTTVGHDVRAGSYLTTSPGVHISGETTIGKHVYLATGCVIRNKVSLTDDVTIGMNSVVNKDITLPGVYVGSPVKKIK